MGNGYKMYLGYIYYSVRYKCLLCKMGLGTISSKINEIRGTTISIKEHEKAINDEGVKRITEEDLFQLQN